MAHTDQPTAPIARLTVTGPGALGERTYSVPVRAEDLYIGRSPRADVCIDEPSVSPHHLRLRWHGTELVARDLHTRWGTALNGKRFTGARYLHDGDVLAVGAVTLRVEALQSTASAVA